ncbi:MAG: hypothetical protein WAV50_02955 [Minisyncoccia bacterium]
MMKNFSMGSFVSGFMLGVLFTGAWLFESDSSLLPFAPASSLSVSDTKQTVPESGAVSVTNQKASSEVVVETVTVPPPGVWVAVREVNGNDLGNVLGAVRVDGPRSNVSIPLLRATEPGLPYAIELYRDDGNNTFDLATDSVYVDFATGAPVIARFTTTD